MNTYLLVGLILLIVVGSVIGIVLGLRKKPSPPVHTKTSLKSFLIEHYKKYLKEGPRNEDFKFSDHQIDQVINIPDDEYYDKLTMYISVVFYYFAVGVNNVSIFDVILFYITKTKNDKELDLYHFIYNTIKTYTNTNDKEELPVLFNGQPMTSGYTHNGTPSRTIKLEDGIITREESSKNKEEILTLDFNLFK